MVKNKSVKSRVPNIALRVQKFIFDRQTPVDIKPIINRSRWKFSLKTDSIHEAEQAGAWHNAHIDSLVRLFRKMGDEELQSFRNALTAYGLGFPDGMPKSPSLSDTIKALTASMLEHEDERFNELTAIKNKSMYEAVSGWSEFGPAMGAQAMAIYGSLYNGFEKHVLDRELASVEAARDALKSEDKQASTPAQDGTLRALIPVWERENRPSEASVIDFTASIVRFEELNGPLQVSEIKKEHVAKFRNALFNMPKVLNNKERGLPFPEIIKLYKDRDVTRLSTATVRKQLTGIKAVLNTAVDNGIIDVSPASGVVVKKQSKGKAKRLAFDVEQLSQITQRAQEADDHIRWGICLAMATGARMGEILSLTSDDIHKKGKLVYISVTDGDDKSLKTESSRRDIPLHPAIAERFYKFAKAAKGRVFDIPADSLGRISGVYSKRVNRFLRTKCGITDSRLTFHSFRHSFKSLCRAASIPEEIHDRLTGHATESVGRTYGGYDIETLAKAVAKIRLPQRL